MLHLVWMDVVYNCDTCCTFGGIAVQAQKCYVGVLQITMEELNVIDKLPHYCPVCAYHEWNLDGLVEMVWDYIDVLRIYTKPKVTYNLQQGMAHLTSLMMRDDLV